MKRFRDSILFRSLLRFFAWWSGMFSLIAGTMNCPCCGQQGCPNGILGAGIFAAIIAGIVAVFRWLGIMKSVKKVCTDNYAHVIPKNNMPQTKD
jgi:hypothetical protein